MPRARLAILALALVPTILTPSCGPSSDRAAAPAIRGLDLEGMDRAIRPGDDFFAYANGTWIAKTPIPADRAEYGIGSEVAEATEQRIADLLRAAAESTVPAGSERRKVGDYFASFMDEAAIEAAGLEPLRPALAEIAALKDRRDLSSRLGGTLRADVDVLNSTDLYTDNVLGLWVAQDLDDPSRYVPFLLQGGLDMPDRDYYLASSERLAELRKRYAVHVAAVLKLAGFADAEARASRAIELERRIAEVHASREETGDVLKGNNHWARAEFSARAPGMDWDAFFSSARLDGVPRFVVWQPGAVAGISALVASEPLEAWKDYLAFHAVEHFAGVLPKAFVEESFAFHGRAIDGTERLRDRWKRAVSATDAALGEAVGKLYVERWFSAAEKARAAAMVANVKAAFGRRIDRLDWMAPETRAKAKAKLAVLEVGVGYPDRWRDYSALEIRRGDAFGNADRAERFAYAESLAKLGRPVDRHEWVMNPQEVNAVNLPAMNGMNFPAAILQPPFFDPDRPLSMDYGSIGSVIGHEISHSFDDQGALFDESGRLSNWWTPPDAEHFKASAARLVAQYDAYRPFPDLAVNGKLTLSENIADVAGLAAALDAFDLALGGKPAPDAAGFTGDQQFFLSFAQGWREKAREPALRRQVIVDGHAPAEYRADAVRNLDRWYDAFDVKAGQKLFLAPGERVRVW